MIPQVRLTAWVQSRASITANPDASPASINSARVGNWGILPSSQIGCSNNWISIEDAWARLSQAQTTGVRQLAKSGMPCERIPLGACVLCSQWQWRLGSCVSEDRPRANLQGDIAGLGRNKDFGRKRAEREKR